LLPQLRVRAVLGVEVEALVFGFDLSPFVFGDHSEVVEHPFQAGQVHGGRLRGAGGWDDAAGDRLDRAVFVVLTVFDEIFGFEFVRVDRDVDISRGRRQVAGGGRVDRGNLAGREAPVFAR